MKGLGKIFGVSSVKLNSILFLLLVLFITLSLAGVAFLISKNPASLPSFHEGMTTDAPSKKTMTPSDSDSDSESKYSKDGTSPSSTTAPSKYSKDGTSPSSTTAPSKYSKDDTSPSSTTAPSNSDSSDKVDVTDIMGLLQSAQDNVSAYGSNASKVAKLKAKQLLNDAIKAIDKA
jgi:hypothetical protein